ncbi:hypothetical protein F9278_21740 [Streptomyces phaeolivaceus]|uniref:Uncharacterized protein n=1 Tax=Streptomyces phaeolivaceus TaxID=2653200 RepID=A0A5P8K5K8_9ACTN|nr:hypothetical protein F9278_21740 [Streptomyces phaeolivaceus]
MSRVVKVVRVTWGGSLGEGVGDWGWGLGVGGWGLATRGWGRGLRVGRGEVGWGRGEVGWSGCVAVAVGGWRVWSGWRWDWGELRCLSG